MANTSSRTLRLLSMLQDRRHWPGAELAARLEVSPRTLRRDVDRLRELGYPVASGRGASGGYHLAAGGALPPLLLDDDEAMALVVGLQAAAQGSVRGAEEAAARALAKVVPVLPTELRGRLEAVRAMTMSAPWRMDSGIAGAGTVGAGTVDPHTLTTLALACRDGRRVGFDYTAADGAESARLVEPHRVVFLGQRWYLVAYDLLRHEWRSFRQDRMRAPRSTSQSFRPRELPAADAAEFVRAGIAGQPSEYHVSAVIEAPAAVVAERIGRWATVTAHGANRSAVAMTAETLDWPAMALGSVGAEFRVTAPPELIAHLREWSERFGRAAASSGPRVGTRR